MQNNSSSSSRGSWDHVASWYDSIVGQKGQYFHTHVIFPKLMELLELKPNLKILDVACGQGVFCRELVKNHCDVTGVDSSPRLIETAMGYVTPTERKNLHYYVDDARTLGRVETQVFDRIVSILAVQNIDPLDGMYRRLSSLVAPGGTLTIVILHPMFRSPRITGWGEDTARKLQYRRIDRYKSPMKIPIDMHPGQRQRQLTWTYHRPLETYVNLAAQNGFAIDALEEWISDKSSEGKFAKMENLARSEIPMFMAIRYRKISSKTVHLL